MSKETDIQQKILEMPEAVEAAYHRIKRHIWKTPLTFSQHLSRETGAEVYLKCENEQLTGSLKIRGAFNKVKLLKESSPELVARGLITASSGNHGIACMQAAQTCGCSMEVFSREGMSQSKLETLQLYGAKLTLFGKDCMDAEVKARQTAQEKDQIYISPYNDWDVAAGQGTIGYEIFEVLPDVEIVLVAVGGGGLIGGIAAYLKSKNPKIQIIGCQPRNSKVMYESVRAGHLLHETSYDTFSDGTSGDIEDESITFPLCQRYVDDWILVDESQISDAVFYIVDKHHKLVEGSAGVPVAALLKNKERFTGKKVAIILCGSNISSRTLKNILDEHI